MDYTGIREVSLTQEELAQFYQGDFPILNLLENQYVFLRDETDKIVDKFFWRAGHLERVPFLTIKNDFCGTIKPRNPYQECAIHMLNDRKAPVKVFTSVYGGGKDFLMSAQAFSLIEKGIFEKLVYIRPNVSLGDIPDIGYLKGDEFSKLSWTLAPLWDKFGGRETVEQMCQNGQIELVPLPHIRGRSFTNALVYVSEAQNITREVARLIISRIGENSEIWYNGDYRQVDRRMYEGDNGLRATIDALAGNPLFEMIYSPITERSEVARLADLI